MFLLNKGMAEHPLLTPIRITYTTTHSGIQDSPTEEDKKTPQKRIKKKSVQFSTTVGKKFEAGLREKAN